MPPTGEPRLPAGRYPPEDGVLRLPAGSRWDRHVPGRDADAFRPAAGYDPGRHHGQELVLGDPAHGGCPTAFRDRVFRAPGPGEAAAVADRLGGAPPAPVAFGGDAGGPRPVTCPIAAAPRGVLTGTVLRSRRERLAPGGRLAPWADPPRRPGGPAVVPPTGAGPAAADGAVRP